ncbi:hypothetical protein F2P81_022726 [Scophthalmus maximus]|uniref:Transmembrane protein n=1 Tax=Scophthalmus maximus TaxID=52904 RepID=A0A6A4S0T2_SCOMX|nr:hypothetical protein F2P81_022726 [Scophthalmus maximus]
MSLPTSCRTDVRILQSFVLRQPTTPRPPAASRPRAGDSRDEESQTRRCFTSVKQTEKKKVENHERTRNRNTRDVFRLPPVSLTVFAVSLLLHFVPQLRVCLHINAT